MKQVTMNNDGTVTITLTLREMDDIQGALIRAVNYWAEKKSHRKLDKEIYQRISNSYAEIWEQFRDITVQMEVTK